MNAARIQMTPETLPIRARSSGASAKAGIVRAAAGREGITSSSATAGRSLTPADYSTIRPRRGTARARPPGVPGAPASPSPTALLPARCRPQLRSPDQRPAVLGPHRHLRPLLSSADVGGIDQQPLLA